MSNVMLITETKLKRLTIHIICDGQFSKKPLQNLSSQKILSDSPHSDSCRTRNIARVALPLLLPSFHYSTELPKHRLLMLMLLTESQLLSKVLWYLCCTELKEPRACIAVKSIQELPQHCFLQKSKFYRASTGSQLSGTHTNLSVKRPTFSIWLWAKDQGHPSP